MKRILLLAVSMMSLANAAMADQIGIYNDATGSSCQIATGFNPNVVIIHKLSLGTTGSRFKMVFSPGSTFFNFATPFTTIGSLTTDLEVQYGQCLTGSFVVGYVVAVFQPGTLEIAPADGAEGYVIAYNCVPVQRYAYTNSACVGGVGNCCSTPVATEPTTWGAVKALYR